MMSCSDSGGCPPTSDADQYITTGLMVSGDYVIEPLSRAEYSDRDLIGIEVETTGKNIDPNCVAANYYAYGLFDDISKATITMLKGNYYRFYVYAIKDAKDILLPGGMPFGGVNWSTGLNQFIYNSSSNTFRQPGLDPLEMKDGHLEINLTYKYYGGEKHVYAETGLSTIDIPLTRRAYGVTVNVKNPTSEGV